jgi:archaellum component FlaC
MNVMQTKIGPVECEFRSANRVSLKAEHVKRGVADYYFSGQAMLKDGKWKIPIQECYFRNNSNDKVHNDVPFKSKEGVVNIIEEVFSEWILNKQAPLLEAELNDCNRILMGKEETVDELEQQIVNTKQEIESLREKIKTLANQWHAALVKE